MIYDEDSAEGNVLMPDDRPALSIRNKDNDYDNDEIDINSPNNDKYYNIKSAGPYTKYNTIERMQQVPLDRMPVKSSSANDIFSAMDHVPYKNINNEKYATIDRIPSKGSGLEKFISMDRIPIKNNKFATVERTYNLHNNEKDFTNSKISPNRFLNNNNNINNNNNNNDNNNNNNNYSSSNNNGSNNNNYGSKRYLSENIPNSRANHDSPNKELINKPSSRPEPLNKPISRNDNRRGGSSSRSRLPSNDRYRSDRHVHRHRRDSPSSERHRRDSPSTERYRKQHSRDNSGNSANSANTNNSNIFSQEDVRFSARKSSLNNPPLSSSSKTHTNSPLTKNETSIRKLNVPSQSPYSNNEYSPSIIRTSPKSIPSSTSHSPISHSPISHSPLSHSPFSRSPRSRSPLSHSPKKSIKEKDLPRDKEKSKMKKSTVTTGNFNFFFFFYYNKLHINYDNNNDNN